MKTKKYLKKKANDDNLIEVSDKEYKKYACNGRNGWVS